MDPTKLNMQGKSVVMALVREGLSICEIAGRIGRSKASVKAWVRMVMFTSRRFFLRRLYKGKLPAINATLTKVRDEISKG